MTEGEIMAQEAVRQVERVEAQHQRLREAAADLSKHLDRWVHASGVRGAQGADVVADAAHRLDLVLAELAR